MNLNFSNNPWHIAILIPARDEELLLPRCLRSVACARAALPSHVTSDVVFVADRCTDSTFSIANKLLRGQGIATTSHYGVVGRARSLAAEIALSRYPGALNRCWLANTDADCELPRTWLTDQLALAEQDVEAVAGIVCVDSFDEHEGHVVDRFREAYLVHPDGTHPHVHGANLGVRADVYRMAGGWNDLSTAEDHDLWNRLNALGRNCCSVSALEITTSGRVTGRAPNGFAGTLAAFDTTLTNESGA
jgi:cellulose synthase/poly-beta-1,6-N-acetylglucosamine synthase-like glycosyltransferase